MIELIFQKKFILIKKLDQKSVCFASTGILKISLKNLTSMFVLNVMIY